MTSEATIDFLPGHGGDLLAIHRLGEGRPVVLLHGLSSSATINWMRYGTAQRLADAGFEAIMIEQRVHGRSAAPQDAAAYPPDVMALDMEAIIPALGLGAFDLVGYSMGARLSTALVLRGMRPRRLVLGGMGLEGLTNWRPRRQFFLDALDRFAVAKAGDADYMAIQFMKTVKTDPVALRHLLLTMPDITREALAGITMPTLILCGADDRDNGSADALVAALPDARRGIIPGNHMSCITLPEFGEAITDYLAA
ncbi:MAG TPA: alpha/beta fold hydrolase [Sphingobium sp.]|nr:alpha/beta fold hydrolase [Sphingobium sp.]